MDDTTWKDFKDFLIKPLRSKVMRNVEVKKRYLEARQVPAQTVSSFIAFFDQLGSQLPLLVSKPQQARDLLHRLQPNISRGIIQLAHVFTRPFEMKAFAIRIEETTCNYCCQVKLPTRNKCCQKGPSKLPTRGLRKSSCLLSK